MRLVSPDLSGIRIPLASHATVATAAPMTLHPPGSGQLRIDLPNGLPAGRYVVLVRFTAEADPARTTLARGIPFIVW